MATVIEVDGLAFDQGELEEYLFALDNYCEPLDIDDGADETAQIAMILELQHVYAINWQAAKAAVSYWIDHFDDLHPIGY